ncbi:hypothetical protein [Paratractidigestivibacter sp.]|uniref:hypothetical protein n=1 Tax=Paratractidigestivibacter sp. TaxID=2847316 RepID=UPI0039FCB80F
MAKRRKEGIDSFWKAERARLSNGESGTRNWSASSAWIFCPARSHSTMGAQCKRTTPTASCFTLTSQTVRRSCIPRYPTSISGAGMAGPTAKAF